VQLNRTAALALLLCACSLRAPRTGASACSSDQQCNGGLASVASANVCFLGECRGHSADLSLVSAEVRPTNDSPFAVTQKAGLDLRLSVVQNLVLTTPVLSVGTIAQQQDIGGQAVVPNADVTFTTHAPAIPDRAQRVETQTNDSGVFSANLPPGQWDVLVQAASPLPPFRASQPFSTGAAVPSLLLPAVGSLVRVQGDVIAAGADLAGASLTAVDASGQPISARAQVSPGNSYSLLLPPSTIRYFLELGPPAILDGSAAPPELATLPNYDQVPGASNIVLPLPPVATLSGTVIDSFGTLLAGVPVYARSTTDEPWTLVRSVTTDSNGVFTLVLRAGNYMIEAAPSTATDEPALSPAQKVTVPVSTGLPAPGVQLICPPKLQRSGLVLTHSGRPVGANYQITATRLSDPLLTTRSATTTPTDATGNFQVTADPGTYRLEITPPASAGLPRRIVQVTLEENGASEFPPIEMDQPLAVVGTVHGASSSGKDTLIAGATVSFFALDTTGASVLLGSALTDENGSYTCVLPDIAAP
jgi:Carboxypeptidase regulatory-like domain